MKRLPTSLYLVAGLLILSGIADACDCVAHWSRGDLWSPLGVINFFIAVGLLRRRKGWRICALVLLWLGIVLLVAFLTYFAFSGEHALVSGPVPAWVSLQPDPVLAGGMAVSFFLGFWCISVLTKRSVVAAFERKHAS